MSENEPTWVVLLRDISHAVKIDGQDAVVAALVLDADTGLARGLSVAASTDQACGDAMHLALTQPAGPLAPQPPIRVVHGEQDADTVRDCLARVLPPTLAPELFAAGPIEEAEDIFDSFVGHLSGRRQPHDPPGPPDWQAFYAVALEYATARPWQRWSDADHLDLMVTIRDVSLVYVAVVLGQAGIQHGLALYPGRELPAGLDDRGTGQSIGMPEGSLVFWLDTRSEVPPLYLAKAARYGWPAEAELVPLPLALDEEGPGDVERYDLEVLTTALSAVLAHDRRSPSPARPAAAESAEQVLTLTEGTLVLTDQEPAGYTIRSV
jgi:hypothetical protein